MRNVSIQETINLEMATENELLQLFWLSEEEQDGKLHKRLVEEVNRRITYDY